MKSKDYKIFLRDWINWPGASLGLNFLEPSNIYDSYMNNLLIEITKEHLKGTARIDSLNIVFSDKSDYLYWYLKVKS